MSAKHGTLLMLLLVILLACSPTVKAQAPDPTEEKPLKPLKPLKDDPGTDCLHYKLDVMSLVTNNVQIFWKREDCILVYVTNNPFMFGYTLSFDEQPIKEDDPLASFGSKVGLNVSSSTPSAQPPTKSPVEETQKKSDDVAATVNSNAIAAYTLTSDMVTNAKTQGGAKTPFQKKLSDDMNLAAKLKATISQIRTAAENKNLAQVKEQLGNAQNQVDQLKKDNVSGADAVKDKLNNIAAAVPDAPTAKDISEWQRAQSDLDSLAAEISSQLDTKVQTYKTFSEGVPAQLAVLSDQKANLDKIKQVASDLQKSAEKTLATINDGDINPENPRSTKLERLFLKYAHDASALHAKMLAKLANDGAQQASKAFNDLHEKAGYVVEQACTYDAESDNDFATIITNLLKPIESVLNDGLSFGYTHAAKKREGPFVDPTGVVMKLARFSVSPFNPVGSGSKAPANKTFSITCSMDPTDMLDHGEDYKAFSDFFSDKAAPGPNTYTRNPNKAKVTNTTATPTPDTAAKPTTSTATDNTVLTQAWLFGKARLVVTGGLSAAILSKQEFQRSTTIFGTGTSTTSSPVIGLKTNTKIRVTPMLYGHTLIYSKRHDSDAWYATIGVTANSDNKSTDPEFLFGGSRSFKQQHFFATAGVYIGEKQKLDGGLQVGQVIPSTLTGDLPVTKGYHTGFGFGVSYRFASTKTPQSDTPNQTKK